MDRTVVRVVPSAKIKDRFYVELDSGENLTVTVAQVADFGLRPGRVFDEAEFGLLTDSVSLTAAKGKALEALARRPLSRREVTERLDRRGVREDIAEETFARLCIKKPASKDTASFKTWLYTIARNLALDRARKRARVAFADDETLAAVPDAADTPEEAYIRRETQQTVRRALMKLRPEYAEVLTLTYIEGLSNRQTARVMRKSVHAVENLNSRARAALKKALQAEGVTG